MEHGDHIRIGRFAYNEACCLELGDANIEKPSRKWIDFIRSIAKDRCVAIVLDDLPQNIRGKAEYPQRVIILSSGASLGTAPYFLASFFLRDLERSSTASYRRAFAQMIERAGCALPRVQYCREYVEAEVNICERSKAFFIQMATGRWRSGIWDILAHWKPSSAKTLDDYCITFTNRLLHNAPYCDYERQIFAKWQTREET